MYIYIYIDILNFEFCRIVSTLRPFLLRGGSGLLRDLLNYQVRLMSGQLLGKARGGEGGGLAVASYPAVPFVPLLQQETNQLMEQPVLRLYPRIGVPPHGGLSPEAKQRLKPRILEIAPCVLDGTFSEVLCLFCGRLEKYN